jgi:hypothetical protein
MRVCPAGMVIGPLWASPETLIFRLVKEGPNSVERGTVRLGGPLERAMNLLREQRPSDLAFTLSCAHRGGRWPDPGPVTATDLLVVEKVSRGECV